MKTQLTETMYLTGAALDWAVALADSQRVAYQSGHLYLVDEKQRRISAWKPSESWAQGGPIIDREHIDIRNTFTKDGYRTSESVDACHASINLPNGSTTYDATKVVWEYGPTQLIAAMRCYVASKLGEKVAIPVDLL